MTATLPPSTDTTPRDRLRASGVFLLALGALVAWAGRDGFVDGAAWRVLHVAPGLVLAVAGAIALVALPRFRSRIAAAELALGAAVDGLAGRRRAVELVALSVLGLFLEVLLIRWHASELRAAAYFKNLTLLAAFLGLGLGFAGAERPRLRLAWMPVMLALQVAVLALLGAAGVDHVLKVPSWQEWVWGVPSAEWDATSTGLQLVFWVQTAAFYGFYALLFMSTIEVFSPIGQITGRLMRGMSPLRAYTLNITGSLGGVALFALVSFAWWPPVTWLAIAGALSIWALRHVASGATLAGACLAASLAVVASNESPNLQVNVHSPYQRLEVERDLLLDDRGRQLDTGVVISANKAYHLRAINLGREFVAANAARFPRLRQMAAAYELPYAFKPAPARVLIVGAGCGNDVAAALRNDARHVDAVEIDPAIFALGRRFHAEQPYGDPRVSVHVTDARAYMRRLGAEGEGRYDLISFGLLDSHTLLSGMSAVRLDNFVYTRESLADARRLLAPDGVLTLSFSTTAGGVLATRLHDVIASVFGHRPRSFQLGYDEGMTFVVGHSIEAASAVRDRLLATDSIIRETAVRLEPDVDPSTDDWPFLYLHGMGWEHLPLIYVALVLMLGAISLVHVLTGPTRQVGFSPHFFFLGAAFLLIEVKGITELALVFGTTWLVSSVVIAAILLLILLANLVVSAWPNQRPALHYALLAVSLVIGYLVPAHSLLAAGWWTAAICATALLLAPLFFAGILFATALAHTPSLPRAFASNLLGAILGGLCEYASMALGFRALYLFGLGLYALSFLTLERRSARK